MKESSKSNPKSKSKLYKKITINKLNKSTNILNNNEEKRRNFSSKINIINNGKIFNSVSIQ